ncbi:MAG: hypothetical protein WBG14_13095 [Rhodococcus sp. (in: high G+C Gram-positive bacteria)]
MPRVPRISRHAPIFAEIEVASRNCSGMVHNFDLGEGARRGVSNSSGTSAML